jgi:dihydroorotate dehydrogenase electron transfer subunit
LTARPFSVADVVEDRIALAFIVVGKGTSKMAEMVPGLAVPLLGPLGRPFDFREPSKRHVMVAGGIGSAPFPLLARVLEEADPDAERVVLLGGRTEGHLYCLERFRELGCDVRLATDDGSAGHHGLVTDLLDPLLTEPGARLYACGPTPMFRTLAARLEGHDIACEISVEPIMACGFGACYGCVVPVREGEGFSYVKSCQEGPTFDIRSLRMDLLATH